MELLNVYELPLSNDEEIKTAQIKILNKEELTTREKVILGRDHPVKEVLGYKLKPDHAYRVVSKDTLDLYLESGYVFSYEGDEYKEYEEDGKIYNNNKGVDWYLGGAGLRYGDYIIECPAYKEYFTLAYDNGTRLSFDPSVRLIKSSGALKPVPISLITNIIDLKELNDIKRK